MYAEFHKKENFMSILTAVRRKAKKKQHTYVSSSPRDHYSESSTWMAALRFESAVT